jgi:hypothetical protein
MGSFNPEPEATMTIPKIHAAAMAVGLLAALPAFAQSSSMQKQQTQEGGPSMTNPCGLSYNGNSNAYPNCKQRSQDLSPSPLQASPAATRQNK